VGQIDGEGVAFNTTEDISTYLNKSSRPIVQEKLIKELFTYFERTEET
jgi:hypothetical protein